MSRVGRKPIVVPDQVTVQLDGRSVRIQGPKGALTHQVPVGVQVSQQDRVVTVAREHEHQAVRALHGLTRTLLHNMMTGVTQGFAKELEIQGVGFKAQVEKGVVTLAVGFSHPVRYTVPAGVTVETPKPTQIIVKGIHKGLVGQVAADLRAIAPAEPYKGVGIRYAGEVVRRKAGKTVATKA